MTVRASKRSAEPQMNAGFRAGSDAVAHADSHSPEGVSAMLSPTRPSRKSAIRFAPRDPGPDMALAATLVFFGVFPILVVTGLMMMQMLGAFAQ
jgi:hypothetical protein